MDSVKSLNRELDRENRGLRALVETYIDARDFDRSLFNMFSPSSANGVVDKSENGGRKRNALDSTRAHMETLNNLDVEMNEILSSIQTEEDRQLAILSQVDTLLSSNEEMLLYVRGLTEQQRDGEGGAGSLTTIASRDIAIQVDEKDSFGIVDEDHASELLLEDIPEYPPGSITIPSLFKPNSVAVPYELRKLMSSFPHVLRIPSIEWTKQSILSIYFSKIRNDAKYSKSILREGTKTLAGYLHEYYTTLYGLPLIADMQIMILLRACNLYAGSSRRVWLFAEQLGLADPEKLPSFGIRDTDLILTVISSLQDQGEFQPIQPTSTIAKNRFNNDRSNDYTPRPLYDSEQKDENPGIISSYIKRASALLTAQSIFEKWLPDAGTEYLSKIRAMPNTKGSFHVDFDDFLEITMEQWSLVKGIWIEHLACLYHYNSSIFRVISEAQFATETGNPDRDTVLAQMIRDSSNPLGTRPVRLFHEAANTAAAAAARKAQLYEKNVQEFQKFKEEGINLPREEGGGKGKKVQAVDGDEEPSRETSKRGKDEKNKKENIAAGDALQSGATKECVVDLMSKKSFVSALKNLKPDLGTNEVSEEIRLPL